MINLSELQDTVITFPQGKTRGTSNVTYTQAAGANQTLLIVEKTPFHPLSCSWPDQQADTGTIKLNGKNFTVSNTLTAAINLEDESGVRLYIDTDIPSRHSAPSWRFFVAHIVDDPAGELGNATGQEVELEVDAEKRKLLSAAHTSTHLAALAMNKAAKDYWRKEVDLDGLGHPDLDKLAMEASKITPGKAIDTYRFGKSLRKKGFEAAAFAGQLDEFAKTVNSQIAEWIATDAKVVIEADGQRLEDRRRWTCNLDGKLVKFPCGGTHLTHLGELRSITVTYELDPEGQGMTMLTLPTLKN